MNDQIFPSLPDDAHVWIHAADRPLKNKELSAIENDLIDFISGWTSHGEKVEAQFRILERRVVLIAARLPSGDVSGCGIDELVRRLEKIATSLDFEWGGPLDVFYRNEDGVYEKRTRQEFEKLVNSGTLSEDTPVLDLSIDTLGEVRQHGIEHALSESWAAEMVGSRR